MTAPTRQQARLQMDRSQTAPVALFDEQSRFVGAIGVRDVLSAVLRR